MRASFALACAYALVSLVPSSARGDGSSRRLRLVPPKPAAPSCLYNQDTSVSCGPATYVGQPGARRFLIELALLHGAATVANTAEGAQAAVEAGVGVAKQFGKQFLCIFMSQKSNQCHHQTCGMDSERQYSLSGTQCNERIGIFLNFIEGAIDGSGALVPEVGLELADALLATAVAMGLSKEDGVTRGAIKSVAPLNAILLSMFLAYSDADVLAEANRESKRLGWGPVYVPSCMYGAFDVALAMSGAVTLAMIGNPAEYERIAGPILQDYKFQLRIFCTSCTVLMELAWRGTYDLYINFMDNSVERLTTGWLRLSAADLATVRDMEISSSVLGVSLVSFNAIYGTPAYILAAIARAMSVNCGIIPNPLSPRRPTGARQQHQLGMRAMLRQLSRNGDANRIDDEWWWRWILWLSLFGGLTAAYCIVGPTLAPDDPYTRMVDRAELETFDDPAAGQTLTYAVPYRREDRVGGARGYGRPGGMPRTVAEMNATAIPLETLGGNIPPLLDPNDPPRNGFIGPPGDRGRGVVRRQEIRDEAGVDRPSDPEQR